MTGDPTPPTEPRSKPLTVALATFAAVLAGVSVAVFSRLPAEAQPWNLSVIGALSLFAAARLGFWPGVAFMAVAIVFKDGAVYAVHGWEPYPLSWLYFTGYVALGWAFLRRTESPVKIGATALSASLLFFVVSNFVSWLEQSLPYGYSLAGLADCYASALPFFRGTFAGDLVFTAGLFGAHAVLSRSYYPSERVVEVESTERGA